MKLFHYFFIIFSVVALILATLRVITLNPGTLVDVTVCFVVNVLALTQYE